MPTIRVIVEDDNGRTSEKTFHIEGTLDTLDAIDEAVEQFKNQTLPQIEQELLQNAQERIAAKEKKTLPVGQR